MNTKQRVSAPRGRASCRFGCQRAGCDRISLPRTPQGRKIATNNFGIREMSDNRKDFAMMQSVRVLGFDPVKNGLHFTNSFGSGIPDYTFRVLGQTLKLGDASNGLCGG